MSRKTVSAMILSLLVLGTLTLASDIQQVKASGTIYIRADGSVDPPTAPISTVDNATYTLTGNITSDADGIVIERDNTIVDAAGYTIQGTGDYPYKGIALSGGSNVTIKNMEINTFSYGIWIDSSDYNSVIGNNITGDGYYNIIQLYYSSNNSIVGNNITQSGGRGFALNYSSSNTISGNNIANNKNYGIGLFSYSDYNIVSGNNITDNDKGVLVYGYSSNNSVIGNNITGSGTGILVEYSSNNRFYHNNFIDNRYPAYVFLGYANVWDDGYPSGGNYWSDYKGTDVYSGPYQNQTGIDGIGDTPYVLDSANKDNYPLMNSWYRMLGDINFDGKVSLQDLVLLALAYGSRTGDANWNPNADIDGNGIVDLADLVILAQNYGQHNP